MVVFREDRQNGCEDVSEFKKPSLPWFVKFGTIRRDQSDQKC